MKSLTLVLALTTILTTCSGAHYMPELIQLPVSDGGSVGAINCDSWRLAVEAGNMIDFETIPKECGKDIGSYMLSSQYQNDSKLVCQIAYFYARSLGPQDGKSIWIFDDDETLLSNIPYHARHGFGVEPFDPEAFTEWVVQANASALPQTLKLYNKLLSLHIKPVLIAGRSARNNKKKATIENLKRVGFSTWEQMIFQTTKEETKAEFKARARKKLVEAGYRIVGNIGDQWNDLIGENQPERTFKLPNPMYFVK